MNSAAMNDLQDTDDVHELRNTLRQTMDSRMCKVKEIMARLEGDHDDMIQSINDEAMKLFTATFAFLSLLSEAGAGPDLNDPLLIKPSIPKHARALLRSIDRMMGDWCQSLDDFVEDAMATMQSSGHRGVSMFARQLEAFKAERLLCEAKVDAAKSAMETKDIQMLYKAMTIKLDGSLHRSVADSRADSLISAKSLGPPGDPSTTGISVSRSFPTESSVEECKTTSRALVPETTFGSISPEEVGGLVRPGPEICATKTHTVPGEYPGPDPKPVEAAGPDLQYTLDVVQRTTRNLIRRLFDSDSLRLLKICPPFKRYPRDLLLDHVEVDLETRTLGGFAIVYKGTYQGKHVAVKRLLATKGITERGRKDATKAFYHECLLWHSLSHENIVPILGIDKQTFKRELCMVMLWMQYGYVKEMISYLAAREHQQNVLSRVHGWIKEIACGLTYLHAQGIAHGDLRGPNILIDDDLHARISDFGLAVYADIIATAFGSVRGGNVRWLAPELMNPTQLLQGALRPTYAGDIYSFGCVCVELYNPYEPFSEYTDFAVMGLVLDGRRPRRPLFRVYGANRYNYYMGDVLWDIVCRCWDHDPNRRPTAATLARILKDANFTLSNDGIGPGTASVYMPDPPQYFEKRRKARIQMRDAVENGSVEKHPSGPTAGSDNQVNVNHNITSSPWSPWRFSNFELLTTLLLVAIATVLPSFLD